ncbi:MAG: response regulator [Bacteroidota bacterium]
MELLDGRSLNILLIDDDETTNFVNARILKKMGLVKTLQIAENGQEALNYLTCDGPFVAKAPNYPRPDLIFLDINMPIMNGWEFLDNYKNLATNKRGNVVVVMLTTSLQKEDHEKAKSSAMIKEMVSKPLNKKAVGAIIARHFEQLSAG